MSLVRQICFLGFIVAFYNGYAQSYETILWEKNKKLSWSDFKSKIPNDDRAVAVTASGITYKYASFLKKGKPKLNFKVSTFFYPNNSWYRPDLCNDLILSHEQLHFDISELYARKLLAELVTIKYSENTRAEVKSVYKRITKALNEHQDLYDTATDYSRDTAQQLLWNTKIAKLLATK